MSTSIATADPASRVQQIRSFLRQHDLRAWIAWRPDELVMMSGYLPYWGASLLIYFANADPVLFVPQLEPRDHIPNGVRVTEYPWSYLKCANPYSFLVSLVRAGLQREAVPPARVGRTSCAARPPLPLPTTHPIPTMSTVSHH